MAAAGRTSKFYKSWKSDRIRKQQETAFYTHNSYPDCGIFSDGKEEFPKNFLRIYSLKKEDNFRGEGRRRKKEKESSISAFLLICSNYSVYIAYNCPTKGRR